MIKRRGIILHRAVPCGMSKEQVANKSKGRKKPTKPKPVKLVEPKEETIEIQQIEPEVVEKALPQTTTEIILETLKDNTGTWLTANSIVERASSLGYWADPPKNASALTSSILSRMAKKPGANVFVKKDTENKNIFLWEK